jgi:hypothetical protein
MAKPLPASGVMHRIIGPVRLSLDDIEELVHLFSVAGLTTSIRDGSYEYESLDDVKARRGLRPRHLTIVGVIKTSHHDFSLSLNGPEASVDTYSTSSFGALPLQIKDFLEERRPLLARLLHPWIWGGASWMSLSLSASTSALLTRIGLQALSVSAPLFVASLLFHRYALGLTLRRRHEGGFLRRNLDQLWLLIIGALVGAAATFLLDLLKRR